MIYLDSSIVLAYVLIEARRPSPDFWRGRTTSSRLLQYEVWNRLHAYAANLSRQDRARTILSRVGFQEMAGKQLMRALLPFPVPVRSLDGLHLATMDHLRQQGLTLTLASYDARLVAAASAMGFATVEP